MEAGPVEAVIVLQPRTGGMPVSVNQKEMMECIQELRKLGPIPGMENPVAWQRAIREDRDIFQQGK